MVELAAFTTSPPLVMRIEVVADSPNTPCVHASYAERPVLSTPSQRSALPVMVEQNTGQVVPVTPPKERPPEILWLVVVALVVVAFPRMLRLPVIVLDAAFTTSPPVVRIMVLVVADCPAAGCVHASYAVKMVESTSEEVMVAHVAAPRAESERTN